MPPFSRPLFNHLRHPTTLSILGFSSFNPSRSLSTSIPCSSASCTRYLIRQPSPAAIRECPIPLIFIRALGLTRSSERDEEAWTEWSSMFAEKGYTAVEIDITAPPSPESTPSPSPSSSSSGPSPFTPMMSLLCSQIRLLAMPFPPILVASGQSCLLTQTYIGDNPASGLVMLDPPPDSDPREVNEKQEQGWEWPKFNYEPRFPILVVSEEGRMGDLREGSRVGGAGDGGVGRGGKAVSVEVVRDGEGRGEGTRVVSSLRSRIALPDLTGELMKSLGRGEVDGRMWVLICGHLALKNVYALSLLHHSCIQ